MTESMFNNLHRSLSMTIIGQTGTGKSALLQNLALDDIVAGRSAIVFDPHGDLVVDVLESLPGEYADQVSVLAVSEDMPFGLNLYECQDRSSSLAIDRTVDNSILVFKRLMQDERGFHPHIEYLLRNLGYTLLANPTYTMAEIGLLFEQSEEGEAFRAALLPQIKNRDIRAFWQGVRDRSKNVAYQYIEPLLNKVSPFTASEAIRLIVSQQHTTIPFTDFLDGGKTLLVYLPIGLLGEEKVAALGMTLLSVLSEQIYERVRQRRERRTPLHLYIDEVGRFASSGTAISKLLTEGRKFNVGTTLTFQTFAQLPDKEAESAVLQTGTLVFFQTIGGYDSEILAKQLKIEPKPAEHIPRMRLKPNIKEWDETDWTSEEAKQRYETAEQLLEAARATIAPMRNDLCWIMQVIEDIYFDNTIRKSFSWEFDERKRELVKNLLQDAPPNEYHSWHSLFFPAGSFFDKGMIECPHCGGYIGEAKKTDNVTRSGVVALRNFRETDTFPFFYIEEAYFLPLLAARSSELGNALREPPDVAVLQQLAAELEQLLLSLYENRQFWFTFQYGKMFGGDPFLEDGEAIRFPLHGKERPITHWPYLGVWKVEGGFPQAVTWLRNKVEPLYAAVTQFEQQEQALLAEMDTLKQEYYLTQHFVEQDGFIQVKREETHLVPLGGGYGRMRGNPTLIEVTREAEQIYDLVADKPRTFADMRGEMETTLTSLPPYTCYMQFLNQQKEIVETSFVTAPPPPKQPDGQERAAAIFKRSREQFGTPATIVEEQAATRIAPFLTKPEEPKEKQSHEAQNEPPNEQKGSKRKRPI